MDRVFMGGDRVQRESYVVEKIKVRVYVGSFGGSFWRFIWVCLSLIIVAQVAGWGGGEDNFCLWRDFYRFGGEIVNLILRRISLFDKVCLLYFFVFRVIKLELVMFFLFLCWRIVSFLFQFFGFVCRGVFLFFISDQFFCGFRGRRC